MEQKFSNFRWITIEIQVNTISHTTLLHNKPIFQFDPPFTGRPRKFRDGVHLSLNNITERLTRKTPSDKSKIQPSSATNLRVTLPRNRRGNWSLVSHRKSGQFAGNWKLLGVRLYPVLSPVALWYTYIYIGDVTRGEPVLGIYYGGGVYRIDCKSHRDTRLFQGRVHSRALW